MPNTTSKKNVTKTNGKQTSKTQPKTSSSFSADANSSMQQLFVMGLREAYWMENHLVKAIPKMVVAAGSSELRQALEEHLEVTKTHASRIEETFEILNQKLIARKCDACEGLTMSGEHVIENTRADTPIRDTGIIMSALKVENFEITTYKGLIKMATSMGKTDVVELLQENLAEEEEASDLLTELSDTSIEEPA